MIPNKEKIDVQGNMADAGFTTASMDFDPGAIKHIMRLLIDLYSDAELAIIRELSTNARDSHIDARQSRPIEIQTPTPLSPYFVVTDYGVGLSEGDIYALFGRYGASTKRGSNDATGMLGLGSKSPLTYTNQFTMTAVKDSVKVVVSIARDEEGVGQITTVATETTSDPNGVSIKIPAKSGNQIEAKARNFFRYWETGTVLVNGKEPEALQDTILIADRITVADRDGNKNVVPCPIRMIQGDRYAGNESVVVMGNVPYPAGDRLSSSQMGMPNGYSIIATVPIGSVDFVPSREALAQNDAQTRRVLEAINSAARAGFMQSIMDEIDAQPTAREALAVAQQWRSALSGTWTHNTPLKWRGKELPLLFKVPSSTRRDAYGRSIQTANGNLFMVNPRYDYGRGKINTYGSIDASQIGTIRLVTGFPMADVTPTTKKKIKQWFENDLTAEERQKVQHVVLIDFAPTESMKTFIDPSMIMDWSVIGDQKLPKQAVTSSGRIPGSFDVVFGGKKRDANSFFRVKHGVPGDDLDQTKPIYWMHGNTQAAYRYTAVLDKIVDEYTIICLSLNRVDKFKRENPKIENVNDNIEGRIKKLADSMSEAEKLAMAITDAGDVAELQALSKYLGSINDPAVVKAVRAASVDVKKYLDARRDFRYAADWPALPEWENPLDSYNLWDARYFASYYDEEDRQEVLRYLNSEYAHRKA